MAALPDEARLIEAAWGIIANADNWKGDPPSSSPDSVEWREAAKRWRDEYHHWLGYYIHTHPADDTDDEKPSIGDLIGALKMVCPCGDCNGAWLTRLEAEHIIERLKTLAYSDRNSDEEVQ